MKILSTQEQTKKFSLFTWYFTWKFFGYFLLGLSFFNLESDLSADAGAVSILVMGDSLSEGFGVSVEESYIAIVQKSLKEKYPNVDITNASISGSLSSSAVSRLRWALKKKRPDIVFLQLGGNDALKRSSLPAIKDSLDRAIQLAHDHEIIVILAGMKIFQNYGADYARGFESIFRDLAAQNSKEDHKVVLVPYLLQGVGGTTEAVLPDGIHPNSIGHKRIANTLLPYFENAIKQVTMAGKVKDNAPKHLKR